MSIKLVTIDLDGTLLRTDKTYDEARFKDLFLKLGERGVIIAIMTGNSIGKVKEYFDDEELEGLYFGCDNGNYVEKNNEMLGQCVIERDTFKRFMDFLDEFPQYSPIASTGAHTYFRRQDMEDYEIAKFYNPGLNLVDSFDEIPADEKIAKIAISSPDTVSENKSMTRVFLELFPEIDSVTSGYGWVDVYHKDGGKGVATKILQDKYGITAEETMAFGDNLNDKTMMEHAYYSMAMDNADPDLVRHSNFKIGHHDDQAVLDVLEQLLEDPELAFVEQYRIKKSR